MLIIQIAFPVSLLDISGRYNPSFFWVNKGFKIEDPETNLTLSVLCVPNLDCESSALIGPEAIQIKLANRFFPGSGCNFTQVNLLELI